MATKVLSAPDVTLNANLAKAALAHLTVYKLKMLKEWEKLPQGDDRRPPESAINNLIQTVDQLKSAMGIS